MNTTFSLRRLLSVIVTTALCTASSAFATSEGGTNQTEAQTDRMSSTEALLNFKIDQSIKHTPSSGCRRARKMEQDRRKLDPQLSASDKKKYLDPVGPDPCKEVESNVPLKR